MQYNVGDIILCTIPGVSHKPVLCKIFKCKTPASILDSEYLVNNIVPIPRPPLDPLPPRLNWNWDINTHNIVCFATEEDFAKHIVDFL